MATHLLKSDKFRKARGGHSRILDVSCAKCGSHLFYYQKDGSGILKRTYLDRIYKSSKYSGLQSKKLKTLPQLSCHKCKEVIGIPVVYKKEKRLAYRLFVGGVTKKIISSDKL